MRALVVSALVLLSCTPMGDPAISPSGFSDDFNRQALGDDWHRTGGNYGLEGGQLHVRGARNHPLWLRRELPRDVRIEFDVKSMSPDGDIKVEVFGDGSSHAEAESYTATSYVIIFGGWGNSTNAIARMNEHGDDRVDGEHFPVEVGRTYRIKIERRGGTITAWADDHMLATMDDDAPLSGDGHDHFAFNNWESDLYFDNLSITPL